MFENDTDQRRRNIKKFIVLIRCRFDFNLTNLLF